MKRKKRQEKREKRKGIIKEFGDFLKRGNALNLAIGVVVGGAFQAIVNSLVKDLIMPLIGVITKVNISDAKAELVPATETSDAVYLMYGAFIQSVINFLIIASAIFVAIKVMTKVSSMVDKTRLELLHKIRELRDDDEVANAEDIIAIEETIAEIEKGDVALEPATKTVVPENSKEISGLLTEIRDLLKKE